MHVSPLIDSAPSLVPFSTTWTYLISSIRQMSPVGPTVLIANILETSALLFLTSVSFVYKDIVFSAQAEYSYISADFRLKVLLFGNLRL